MDFVLNIVACGDVGVFVTLINPACIACNPIKI